LFLVFIIICEEVIFLRIDKIILLCRLFVKARITYSPFHFIVDPIIWADRNNMLFLTFFEYKFINIS